MPAQADIEHLLRRTEFVARPARVTELVVKPDLAAAVDDVLNISPGAPTITLNAPSNWERQEQYVHFWFDQMAHDAGRPIREKMAFFLHGHFCSDIEKAERAELMQQQLDTFRANALGDVRVIAKTMSTQVAMLRYLDNNDNRRTSPNQNFGRELMELFILGVGNYSEADVEACTAAWTGHTDQWDTHAYRWRADWHDNADKTLLGRVINQAKTDADQRAHGYETIDVMLGGTPLGNGVVPGDAANAPNRGRPTRDVAAEFISRKLWTFFAGTVAPAAVITAMRDAALAANFALKPWLRTMLLRPEFYTAEVRGGLVRSPVDLNVAMLVASGRRSTDTTPMWLLEGMGQRPMFPPNVSGWRHNGYFVNASAMASRTDAAHMFFWRLMDTYWDDAGPGAGQISLPGGIITRQQIIDTTTNVTLIRQLVDRFLSYMSLNPGPTTRTALYTFAERVSRWERVQVLLLIFLMPELHVA